MKTRTLFIGIMLSGLLLAGGFSGSCAEGVKAPTGWKTFHDETHSLQFDYPENWQPWREGIFAALSVYGFSIPDVNIDYLNEFGFVDNDNLDKIKRNVYVAATWQSMIPESLEEYKAALLTGPHSRSHFIPEEAIILSEKAIEIGGRNGHELILTGTYEGVNLKQKLLIFSAYDGLGYTLTCSAPENIFSDYDFIFDEIIDSFTIPATNPLSLP